MRNPDRNMGDPRTPMAWQHRDTNYRNGGGETNGFDHRYQSDMTPYDSGAGSPGGRHYTNGGSRYGGPPTPSSAHSRATRTSEHRRREARGSSSERFSQHSGRKMSSRDSRDGRAQMGSRNSRSSHPYRGMGHNGYARSKHSPDSTTEETTEETTETDSQAAPDRSDYSRQTQPHPMYTAGYAVPVGFPIQPQIMGPIAPPQLIMAPNGSIRSVQSVPMLAAAAAASAPTWDGEPCPVHHHNPHAHAAAAMPLAALYGIHGPPPAHHQTMSMGPSSVPPSIISGATTVRRARSVAEISVNGGFVPPGTPRLDHKSFHGSMHHMNGMAGMGAAAPVMMRAGTLPANARVVVAENGAPSALPMRDPKNRSPLPPKNEKHDGLDCCSGHFVVVWIILGIITFGILLGIILKFTIA